MIETFLFILNLVAPVFLIVGVGFVLKLFNMINDDFVSLSSKIVFNVSLPALIFTEVSNLKINELIRFDVIVFVYAGTLISFLFVWIISKRIKTPTDRGVFIQGSFRGNFAIIGLALILNIFGKSTLGKASLVLAFTVPLYNVLSVIALTIPLKKEKRISAVSSFIEIIKNPLIIAVFLALPFSYYHLSIPFFAVKTVNYLAALSLPLALIGIGGFMKFNEVKNEIMLTVYSSFLKLIVIPFAATYIAVLLGFRGDDLGIIFILFSCPTAIASFIMAKAMGSNGKLAANILLITTLFSAVTITLGLFVLKLKGVI